MIFLQRFGLQIFFQLFFFLLPRCRFVAPASHCSHPWKRPLRSLLHDHLPVHSRALPDSHQVGAETFVSPHVPPCGPPSYQPFFLLGVGRQNALGYNNSIARVGVALAPLILLLEDVWTVLPQVIICLIPIACGLLSLLLPETKGVRLPESIDDVEKQRSVESVRFQRLDMKFDTVQQNNFPAHLHFLPSSPVLNHPFIPHSLTSSLVLAHLVPLALHLTISLPHPSYFIPSSLMNQIVSLSFGFQGDAGVRGERRGSGNLPGIQERKRASQSRKLRGAAGQISRGSARFLPQLSHAVIGTCPNRICPNCSSGCRWTWELQDQSCTGQLELDNVRRRAQN